MIAGRSGFAILGTLCLRDPFHDDVAEAISKESLAALRRVQEEVGPDGLHTLGTLLDAGVSPEDAARVLNDNQFADGFRTKDELKAFHDSLEGATAVPEFHHLVLILVEELGHTISEAVAEVRNNRAFVLRLLGHSRYLKTYRAVRRWLSYDKLSDAAKKQEYENYVRNGPDGELAAMVLERIRARESAEAKAAMDARDAVLREKQKCQ